MTLLSVHNLGKAYRGYTSEWHRVGRLAGLPIRPREEHWVLRHISFDIGAGEAIGIIGQNGAGKSTLLKIITGTTAPSEGSCYVQGRVSAILELGMGFNPELTGRQNVLHAAGLMGFTDQQIEDAIPGIEDFAEIGEYFDAPVRTYSSGMYLRVAFSVATAYRPEILIVDEALSVGDAYFQHKSFRRIREFQQQGTTLLIVSHDRGSILTLCNRAILLERGAMIRDGDPDEVFDYYNAIVADKERKTVEVNRLEDGKAQTKSGSGEAQVESVELLNQNDEPVEFVSVGEPVTLRIRVKVNQPLPELVLGYMLKDRLGNQVFGTNTYHLDRVLKDLAAGERIEFRFSFAASLGIGSYSVATALHTMDTHLSNNYEWTELALVFNVVNQHEKQFVGVSWLPPEVECMR